jgi:alanine racemase
MRESEGVVFDPNALEIDLDAVADNYREIKRRAGPGRKIIGVIKADGYGHGAPAVALTLARLDVDFLASGSLREAVAVRRSGIATPIVLLGNLSVEAIPTVVAAHLIPSLDNALAAAALSDSVSTEFPVFIKVDCGFGRFGVPLHAAAQFVQYVSELPRLNVEGLYTHLPFADIAGQSWAQRQTSGFDALIAELGNRGLTAPIIQSLSSPGLLARIRDHSTAIAAGHLLYGISPVSRALADAAGLGKFRPAFRGLRAKLLHVGGHLADDESAPYLRAHNGRIGVASIGIHHGYRPTSGAAFVVVRGTAARILRVCLENTIIDLAQIPDATIGDDVIVVGGKGGVQITLQDLAEWQTTSPLALLTAFGKSVPRRYFETSPLL